MKIKSGIDCSTIFLSCVTKSYLKNKNCLNEIDYAYEHKKPIVVLQFEELTQEETFSINSKCHPPIEQIKVCDDTEKIFLTGQGVVFEKIIFKIQNLVRKSEPIVSDQSLEEKADSSLKKLYDLFVTSDDSESTHVSQFLSKLKPIKNL